MALKDIRHGADRKAPRAARARDAAKAARSGRAGGGRHGQEKKSFTADRAGALFCLCLAAREEPDVTLWSSLAEGREECPALYRRCLSYLKSALEGSSSPKGLQSRLEEVDLMIDLTGSTEGGSLGDAIALAALELLRTGIASLIGGEEETDIPSSARSLDLALLSDVLDAREFDEESRQAALESEGALLDELLEMSRKLEAPDGERGAVRAALRRALGDGVSAAGIEATQPALA